MDLLFPLLPPQPLFGSSSPTVELLLHAVPYAILLINSIIFKFIRAILNSTLDYYFVDSNYKVGASSSGTPARGKLLRLFIAELVSTCELCADCAELNVVYERHGSFAYGASLFLLSYLWIDSFGDAHTTPGYLFEDLMLVQGNKTITNGDAYVRFIGQSVAMPMAWRLASFYWKYELLNEHREYLVTENCKTALTTSTLCGFAIELGCCFACRLVELIGHKLHENNWLSQRVVSLTTSFLGTLLVVMALELSGGYFNPILAASLEYGCRGIEFYQHAAVFWLGPLLGHLLARVLYRRFAEPMMSSNDKPKPLDGHKRSESRRLTRSTSQKSKKKRHVD